MNRFLKDQMERGARQKRGGGQVFLFIDALNAEERYRVEPLDPLDPEALFMRRWAMTVLDEALQQLASEMVKAGKNDMFLRLEGFLVGDKAGGTYREAASDLGMSEAAIKMAV